jgi:hypothetical protein
MENINSNIQNCILSEIAKYPNGIGLMGIAKPFLDRYSETALRYNIRLLTLKGKIRAEKFVDRIVLYPVREE